MSAFERRVRVRKTSAGTSADTGFEALAQGIAAGNSDDELIERAALAYRAFEIRQNIAREAQVEQTRERRDALARYGAAHGLADDDGNVRRLDVKRALRAEQRQLPNTPAKPREAPSEPRRAPGRIILPEGAEASFYGRREP